MIGPREGEPFFDYPGPAISLGDMGAMRGTEAYRAIDVIDVGGLPSRHIINTGEPFNLRVIVKTVAIEPGFLVPAGLTGNFHFLNLLTGTAAPIVPATGPTELATAPDGDTGPRDIGDVVRWYEFTATGLTLPAGTYRIIAHGHEFEFGLMFFHDGAVIHVGP